MKKGEPNRDHDPQDDELKLFREMKRIADTGCDVELRRDANGNYKILSVQKKIITTVA